MRRLVFIVVVLVLTTVCAGPFSPKVQGPEEFCASALGTNAFGAAFYCGTTLASLDVVQFPDKSRGYCMWASENLSNVGYSAYSASSGGADTVKSQAGASAWCSNPHNYCSGMIRCTRP